jgi:hypothetical protein
MGGKIGIASGELDEAAVPRDRAVLDDRNIALRCAASRRRTRAGHELANVSQDLEHRCIV